MGKWKIGLTLWMVLMLAVAAGCKKEDPKDGDDTPDPPETSVTFTCQDTAGGLQGILVGISPLESDRDAGTFLRSGDTDFGGKIEFSNLAPQTYYYSCSRAVPGGVVTRKGAVTVDQDEEERVTVNF